MGGSAFDALVGGAPGDDHFGAAALVQALLDVEAALVQSLAAAGQVSEAVASTIAGVCKVGLFDHDAVIKAAARHGDVAAEVADRLRETVALFDAAAAAEVHRELGDSDALQLAQLLLVRRALAALDADLSTIADALSERLSDGPPAREALDRALQLQDRIRKAGAAALSWASHEDAAAVPSPASRCARRLQLAVVPARAAVPTWHGDEAMSLLLCVLARAGSDLETVAGVLRRSAGSMDDSAARERIGRAEQLVELIALRAPQRVAAWLACLAARSHAEAAATEAAALIESALAAAGLLAEISRLLPTAGGAGATGSIGPGLDPGREPRAAPPWQQWLG